MIKWLFISDNDEIETIESESLVEAVTIYMSNYGYPRAIIRSRV